MYQFIHVETYARKASTKTKPTKKKKQPSAATAPSGVEVVEPKGMDQFTKADGSKGKKGKSTMADVISEALREETHCAHVDEPMPPTFLVGEADTLLHLEKEIEQKCAAEKIRTGVAPRKDMHVLLAGVASYPRALAMEDPEGYDRWEKATVKWLQGKYGDKLRCVLRHDDEAHPHIHFFVCDRERVNAKELHDGYAAVAKAPGVKAVSKEGTQVHNDAMRDFQSDYYAQVGHAAGLQRDGPKRLRLDRPTYNARQREARERVALTREAEQAMGALLDDAAIEARTAAEMRRNVEREAGALGVERAELDQLRDTLQRERDAVDGEWTSAREARATAARFESDAERKLSGLDKQAAAMERVRIASEEAKAQAALATQARDREADALRTEKASAVAFSKKFQGQLAGLGAVEDVRALVRKPELVAMVEFIDQNPRVAKLLDALKAEPFLVDVLAESVEANQALGVGEEPATWEAPRQVSVAATFLKSLDEVDQAKGLVRDSGMTFGG